MERVGMLSRRALLRGAVGLAGTAVLGRTILGCEKAPVSKKATDNIAMARGRTVEELGELTWELYGFDLVNYKPGVIAELEVIINTDRVNTVKFKGESGKKYLNYRQNEETHNTRRLYFSADNRDIIRIDTHYPTINVVVTFASGREEEIQLEWIGSGQIIVE